MMKEFFGKTWKILVNRDNGHDKFWAYKNAGDDVIKVRYGRIGSIGVELSYDEGQFLDKWSEKLGHKGYREATQQEVAVLFPQKILMMWEV
jgi:predicted DNA-binding WGR domain protein